MIDWTTPQSPADVAVDRFLSGDVEHYREPGDPADMLASGWLPDITRPPLWFASRSLRLDLSAYRRRTVPRDEVAFYTTPGSTWSDEHAAVWDRYLAARGFEARWSPADAAAGRCLLECWVGGELAAWTLYERHPGAWVSLRFAWDYARPDLRVGYRMQDEEARRAAALGAAHVYLMQAHGRTAIWKARLPGAEWWTGRAWSRDSRALVALLEAEG